MMIDKPTIDNEFAFNDLYNQYWPELYTYAYNIMRDKNVAEDIIQEIFIDIWLRLGKVDIQNHKAYLYKAVKFQCASKLKNRIFSELQVEKIELALTIIERSDFAQEELRHNLLERIETRASEILPDRCLHVFRLRYYENMSYLEIASKLGISVSTVENQLNKALKLLRAEELLIALAITSYQVSLCDPSVTCMM